jgi:hypothetical protein
MNLEKICKFNYWYIFHICLGIVIRLLTDKYEILTYVVLLHLICGQFFAQKICSGYMWDELDTAGIIIGFIGCDLTYSYKTVLF